MLRSFRLVNHRSFASEQELSLLPVCDGEQDVLPVAAIYGANASGKSNLLDGLAFMRHAVLHSFRGWEADGGVPRHPFRLDAALGAQPSGYVVDVVVDEVRHTYGFTVSGDRVLEEWLHSYPEKKKRVLFERLDGRISFGSTLGGIRAELDVLHELTRPNALFLSGAAQSESEPMLPIHRWFRTGITLPPGSPDEIAERMKAFLDDDPERGRVVVALLTAADMGISDLRTDPKLLFRHDGSDELFDIEDESAGVRSLTNLLPCLLQALESGGAIVLDGFDASLHPLLTARLVGLFREPETNPHGAQLIFTTKDTSLLGSALGEEMLARDQIWFVEKDGKGTSRLFPLSDFKPRENENWERRYRGGSYGAVPVVSSIGFANAVRSAAEMWSDSAGNGRISGT